MDNSKNLILALVLCVAILYGWQAFSEYMGWVPPAQEQTANVKQEAPKKPEPAVVQPSLPVAKFKPSEGREVRVSTPYYDAVFHTGGGVLQSFKLKQYNASLGKEDRFDMVSEAAATVAPMGLLINGQPSWAQGKWEFSGSDLILDNGSGSLTFIGEVNGTKLERVLTFHAENYLINEETKIVSQNTIPLARMGYTISATNFSSESTYDAMSVACSIKDSLDRETDVSDLTKEGKLKNGLINWAGLMSNYFLSAIIPDAGKEYVFKSRITEGNIWRGALELQNFALEAGQPVTIHNAWWIGPKIRDMLSNAPNGLKNSIDMGIFTFLAVPLLKILTWFYGFVGNWGIAIIILTILIKIVFWPLSRKSFKSMEQMKKLQPMMKKIQEQYKDDKQEMSKQTMQLYKTYGVNPMGGCLPILIQLPVFVALYQALLNCIELRHASFITYLPGTDLYWLADLSVKDPYYITPLIMGATMFLQQWLSPAMGDPTQRKMMMIMPLVFTVMFINFPSGLVLYWLCNNILSIAQQSWTLHKTK